VQQIQAAAAAAVLHMEMSGIVQMKPITRVMENQAPLAL
jgi:hypothetical protein